MQNTSRPASGKENASPVRIWAGRILDLVLVLLIVAALLFARSENPDKTIFGYRIYMVLSNSMEPEMPEGSMVLVQEVSPSSLQVGDTITFHTDDDAHQVITHRIVQIIENYEGTGQPGFVTQGVARSAPDSEVRPAASVLGRVTLCVPLLGYVLAFFQSNLFIILLLILIAAVAVILIRKIWRS